MPSLLPSAHWGIDVLTAVSSELSTRAPRRQPLSPGLRTTSRHWSAWHAPEWMPDSVDVSQVVSVPAVLRNHASLQKSIGDNGSRSVLNVQEVNVLREVVHPNVVQVRQCPTSRWLFVEIG